VTNQKILDIPLTLETFEIFPNDTEPCRFGSGIDFVIVIFFQNNTSSESIISIVGRKLKSMRVFVHTMHGRV